MKKWAIVGVTGIAVCIAIAVPLILMAITDILQSISVIIACWAVITGCTDKEKDLAQRREDAKKRVEVVPALRAGIETGLYGAKSGHIVAVAVLGKQSNSIKIIRCSVETGVISHRYERT